jgi:putative heme-binding domain-containing protein
MAKLATIASILGACGLLYSQQDPLASLSSEDVAAGKLLYEGHCAACHAPDGSGGRGARLAMPRLRHAADNQALIRVIQRGIPGTEMPATWQMTDGETLRVAAYVRSLGRTKVEPLPGDAARGRILYVSNACEQCHIVRGEGSGIGPELTDIGARRNAAYLREALLEPAKSAPDQFMVVKAKTREGRAVEGIRLNEDPFTIQIRDSSNRLHSLRKSALAEFQKLPGRTPMPTYTRLAPRDLDDLVAYLASLRGEP